MPNIGPLELAIVLIIALVIFGPKRLPGLGKQLGTGMREFKDSLTGDSDRDDDDDELKPAAKSAPAELPAPAPETPAPTPLTDDTPVSGS